MADLNLFDTGFGVSAVGHQSLSNGFGELPRWDGTFYYQNGLFAGETLATNYQLGYVYYYYPKPNFGLTQDLMEGHLVLSWPNLLPIKGLQPSYVFAYMLPGMKNHWAESSEPRFQPQLHGHVPHRHVGLRLHPPGPDSLDGRAGDQAALRGGLQ